MMNFGSCSVCKEVLSDEDIDDDEFRGTITHHIAYRCRKCDTIIGFSGIRTIA